MEIAGTVQKAGMIVMVPCMIVIGIQEMATVQSMAMALQIEERLLIKHAVHVVVDLLVLVLAVT
jgi:hypothetical protein